MDLKILLLHSLSSPSPIEKCQRLWFNNCCYLVSYQINGKFFTVKNIRKIVKKRTRKNQNISVNQRIAHEQPFVSQSILVDMEVQTQNLTVVQCKSISTETANMETKDQSQQTVFENVCLKAIQTENKSISDGTQTLKYITCQVTQTEKQLFMQDKSTQTITMYTAENKTQTRKLCIKPNRTSQTPVLVTSDHINQTIPGYGMPHKTSQTPLLYTVDNMAQTVPGYGMPDKRSQTTSESKTDKKSQTSHYGMPDKKSQTTSLVTTDHIIQTIPGYGMPDKKSQTIPLPTLNQKIQIVPKDLELEKRLNWSSQSFTVDYSVPALYDHEKITSKHRIPTFVSNCTTQTEMYDEAPQKRSHNVYCSNCSYAMNTELNAHKEQTQVEKDAVVLMLNEIGEMIINQNYLLHNNSTLLGQISEITLLKKMVSRQNSTIKLRTKLENQRKIRNYMRERSKKVKYIYYQTAKFTETSNALLQTIEYQLNASTQTRKDEFPNKKTKRMRKFLSPLT